MATNRLVEAVPPHLRFSSREGAPTKRNILIRNISVGELPVLVTLPGLPFRITHGAERVGSAVKLRPGETLGFGVAVDRAALPADGSPVCDFLIVQVHMCQPFPVDFVVAPEDMGKDQVQQLVRRCLPTSAPIAVPVSGGAAEPSGAGAQPGSLEVALAMFLGESPAPAAVRRLSPSPGAGRGAAAVGTARRVAGAAHRGRGGDSSPDSQADSAEPPTAVEDDDRPPTPAPKGFEANLRQPEPAPRPLLEASRERVGVAIERVPPHVTPLATATPTRRREAPRSSSVPAELGPPQGMDNLFFMEGVGWCNEYGEVASCSRGDSGGSNSMHRLRSTSRNRTQCTSLAMSGTQRRCNSRTAESVKSRTGGCGLPKPSGGCASVAPQQRLSMRELDANWAALGGI